MKNLFFNGPKPLLNRGGIQNYLLPGDSGTPKSP